MERNELIEISKAVELPEWATHVAIRKDGSKKEPCAWLEKASDYIDEDPSKLPPQCWAGSYKHCYWDFISRD